MLYDFSFPNDIWQLAFCYRVMMNGGEWHLEANKSQGDAIYDLLVDMYTED